MKKIFFILALLASISCASFGAGHKISLVPELDFGWSFFNNGYVYKPGRVGGGVGMGYRFLPWGDGCPSFGLYGGIGYSAFASADVDHITDAVDMVTDFDYESIDQYENLPESEKRAMEQKYMDEAEQMINIVKKSDGGFFYTTAVSEFVKLQLLSAGNRGFLVDLGLKFYQYDDVFHCYSVSYQGKKDFKPYTNSKSTKFGEFVVGLGYSARHCQFIANMEFGRHGLDNVGLKIAVPITLASFGKGKHGKFTKVKSDEKEEEDVLPPSPEQALPSQDSGSSSEASGDKKDGLND